MWVLRSSPASPFGRKVKIAAAVCALDGRFKEQPTDTADASDPVRRDNPLGKIPTLVLEDGTALYDSRVIVEFLDAEAGGGVIIPAVADRRARFRVLTLQALADGLLDASLLRVYEGRWRAPERHEPRWIEHQKGKVERGMASLEASPPKLSKVPDIGQIAVACVLGYLDLRFAGEWRGSYSRLVEWLDEFAAGVPSFEATRASS